MYYRYFGLQEEPFSIAVNPRYLFMSARHRDALAHLLYGVGAGGGFILLTGEVGTGKTTINRCLLEQLPADTDIAIILNPALNADELLATVCDELGISYDASTATLKDLTDKLHSFLLENHRQGRNTVLLIDEAQHLQFDVLEQIRLLTNLETNTRKLLQIILVGQPELGSMLAKPELRQLSQRITARYNLAPLNRAETDAYIRHRLQVAGLPANQELFPAAVVAGVFKHTRGIPRLINVLCDRSLLGSYGQNQSKVSMKMLRQAVREVMGEDSKRPVGSGWMWGLAAVLVLGLGIGLANWYLPGNNSPTPASEPELVREEMPPAALPVGPPAVLMRDRQAALAALSSYMGVAVDPAMNVCDQLQQGNWQCEFLRAASWNDLLEFGRPVVLTLVTPSRFISYAVLIGIDSEIGLVLHEGVQHPVPLTELGPMWRGEFQLFWQPPVDYAGPVSLGARGPMVAWLAREFARLDEQSQPLAEDEFNAALEARVRLFQRQFNLLDDGVVGLKTLLRLNAARGVGVPLMGSAAEFASLGQG